MADISAINTILNSIKAASDIVKLLINSKLSLGDAEIRINMTELMNALADARMEIVEVREILLEKELRIKELEKILLLQSEMKWRGTVYYRVREGEGEGQEQEGPFCPQCYDSSNKLIRLQRDELCWDCLTCGKHFDLS